MNCLGSSSVCMWLCCKLVSKWHNKALLTSLEVFYCGDFSKSLECIVGKPCLGRCQHLALVRLCVPVTDLFI